MITDAAVEAVANAISKSSGLRYDGFWVTVDMLEPEDREHALTEARQALEAGLPHLKAPYGPLLAVHALADRAAKDAADYGRSAGCVTVPALLSALSDERKDAAS